MQGHRQQTAEPLAAAVLNSLKQSGEVQAAASDYSLETLWVCLLTLKLCFNSNGSTLPLLVQQFAIESLLLIYLAYSTRTLIFCRAYFFSLLQCGDDFRCRKMILFYFVL